MHVKLCWKDRLLKTESLELIGMWLILKRNKEQNSGTHGVKVRREIWRCIHFNYSLRREVSHIRDRLDAASQKALLNPLP